MKCPGLLARKTQRFAVVAWNYNNVASYVLYHQQTLPYK